MGAAGVRRGICSVNDGWRFEERDRVEREMERGWGRRGRDSGVWVLGMEHAKKKGRGLKDLNRFIRGEPGFFSFSL